MIKNSRFLLFNYSNKLTRFSNLNYFTTTSSNLNKEWNRELTKAEKVVGYPTSFLNLRYLVSDEVANFANLLRKLMKTKHPLIKIGRKLISNGSDNDSKQSLQINGLLVLLIAKAAGIPKKSDFFENDISDGIHSSQRSLAEIAEMIYMGSLIHKGILDLNQIDKLEYQSMDQGNKLAVLCGDYLLASACTNLSKLKNTQVVDLMSQVIADISQGIFINNQSSKLKIWYENINSNSSSLLANSAKSAMLLVSHNLKLQETAWNFAKHLDITHKIWTDLHDFKKDVNLIYNPDSILNAVLKDKYSDFNLNELTLDENLNKKSFISNIYSNLTSSNNKNKNNPNEKLIQDVFYDCKSIFQAHYNNAIESLEQLENEHSEKDALNSLKSILNVMKNTV